MRKRFSIALIVALTIGSLSGCASSAANAPSAPAAPAGEKVELSFSIWDKNQLPGMEDLAAAYTVQNPNITVKVEVTPWDEYWTKLEAGALGGSMPDIFWMHTNEFYKYAVNNTLVPIEEGTIDTTKFPKGLIDLYTLDSKLYGVPKDFDTIGLIYNKNIFDEAGIAYPDATWDWNKLLEVSQKLTKPDKSQYGFAAAMTDQEGYHDMIYQNNGFVVDNVKKISGYNTPETIEAVQFYFDLVHKYKVSPPVEYIAENNVDNLFASGKVAMMFRGSWMLSSLMKDELTKDKFDIAVLPKGKKNATMYNGLSYAGFAQSKHPAEVKSFLTFLGTEEANVVQGKSGAAIPAYEGTQQYWIDKYSQYNVKAFVDMLAYAVTSPSSKTRPQWKEIENSSLKKVASGEMNAPEACQYIYDEMTKLLATE